MDKRKKAIEILEALQLSNYENFDKFQEIVNNIYNSIDDSLKDLQGEYNYVYDNKYFETLKEPISKYQNKVYYDIYLKMIKQLESSYKKIFKKSPIETPIFGTLPVASFSAYLSRTNESDGIIIISEGLRAFSFSISKIVSLSLKIIETEDGMDATTIRKYIKANIKKKDLNSIFSGLLLEHYFFGRCKHIGIEFPTKLYFLLTMWMSRSINYFVLAHEYIHYCENHSNLDKNQSEIWGNELEADYKAIYLTLDAMSNEVNPTYILWGIYTFLKSLETFEIFDLALTNYLSFETHPPFIIRKAKLLKVIEELNTSEGFHDLGAFDYIFNLLRIGFSSLIDEIKQLRPKPNC